MKDFFIADAARFENQVVTSFFCLASLQCPRAQGDGGGQYLALTLADKTGQFEARMWEEFADVLETCSEGCYVKVQGQISKYQGKFQITLTQDALRRRTPRSTPADFVPTTQFDIADMDAELRGYVDAFSNPHLRALVLSFLDDPPSARRSARRPRPSGCTMPGSAACWNTCSRLVRVCRATAPFYPEVDPDLLVTGAILHDIGKVRELSWGSSFNYTLEGPAHRPHLHRAGHAAREDRGAECRSARGFARQPYGMRRGSGRGCSRAACSPSLS